MTNQPGVGDHAAPEYEILPKGKTEPKVKAATIGSGVGAIVSAFSLYVIDQVWYGGADSPPEVPFAVAGFVGLLVTSGLTFAGGWWGKHVNRVD